MYCVVEKAGRGSWQMSTSRVFDDRDKAAVFAAGARKRANEHKGAVGEFQCKVAYMGDADLWKDS